MFKYFLLNGLLASLLLLTFTELTISQTAIRQKSVMGQAGVSKNIRFNNQSYYMRQSIGQYGIQGTHTKNKITLVQGFIQPFLFNKQIIYPADLKVEIKNISNNDVYSISILEPTTSPLYLSLYNLKGQRLNFTELEKINEFELNLSSYSSGCYILNICNNHQKYSTRLVKTH
jgi:hypothetical protein